MKESYERISPTAKLVAHLRTSIDIPFAKEVAEESGGPTRKGIDPSPH